METSRLIEDSKKQDLRQVWGDFADAVGQRRGGWDWFFTGTFRDREYDPRTPNWDKVGWAYSETALNKFLGVVRDLKGLGDFHWFRAREYQHWRGVPHWHALLGGVSELRREEAWAWWFEHYGQARILPYDSKLGARFYLCKYVTKQLGDIRFSQNLATDAKNLTMASGVYYDVI